MFDTGGISMRIPEFLWKEILTKYGDGTSSIDCNKMRSANPYVKFLASESEALMEYPLVDSLPEGCASVSSLDGVRATLSGPTSPPLFKNYYTVWDYEHNSYYIGKRNKNPGPPDIEIISKDTEWTPKILHS